LQIFVFKQKVKNSKAKIDPTLQQEKVLVACDVFY